MTCAARSPRWGSSCWVESRASPPWRGGASAPSRCPPTISSSLPVSTARPGRRGARASPRSGPCRSSTCNTSTSQSGPWRWRWTSAGCRCRARRPSCTAAQHLRGWWYLAPTTTAVRPTAASAPSSPPRPPTRRGGGSAGPGTERVRPAPSLQHLHVVGAPPGLGGSGHGLFQPGGPVVRTLPHEPRGATCPRPPPIQLMGPPPRRRDLLERVFLPLMRDERDLVFVRVAAVMTVTVVPLGLFVFSLPPWAVAAVALPYLGFVFLGFGGGGSASCCTRWGTARSSSGSTATSRATSRGCSAPSWATRRHRSRRTTCGCTTPRTTCSATAPPRCPTAATASRTSCTTSCASSSWATSTCSGT